MFTLPPYNPDADKALQKLKDEFALVANFFNQGKEACLEWEDDLHHAGIARQRYMQNYRKVFLSKFNSMSDLQNTLDSLDYKGKDSFEIFSISGVRDAFLGKKGLPYGQPSGLANPVFASENISYAVKRFPNLGNYEPVDAEKWPYHTSLLTCEVTEKVINIAFTATAQNGLPNKIDYMADIVASDVMVAIGARLPVQVFLHVPAEFNLRSSDSFFLIESDEVREYPKMRQLDKIPKALDYGYLKHASDITTMQEPFSKFQDFREFALRVV